MECQLHWLTEDEGEIVFVEQKKEWLCVQFFVISEEEAELKLRRLKIVDTTDEIVNISPEIISKVTECILEAFRLLWEEGYEETILVERKGSFFSKILDSTGVVQNVYSEYMMCCEILQTQYIVQNSEYWNNIGTIQHRPNRLLGNITEEEDGLVCENKEGTFFCRLLPYESKGDDVQSFYLYEVEVDEAVRNQGIATACLKELFVTLSKEAAGNPNAARKQVKILLQVGSYNAPAVHLYKKLGFEIYEELCCYVPEEA